MPLDLMVVSLARRATGYSLIGFDGTQFVRLMAPTPDGILYPDQCRIADLFLPGLWDRIRVEAPWRDSRPHQPENIVVDDRPFVLLERPASRPYLTALEGLAPATGPLFGTETGWVRATDPPPGASILYVEPEAVRAVCHWDAPRERYQSRIRFRSDGINYDLPLTDRRFGLPFHRLGEGEHTLEEAGCRAPHGLRMIVTLGEPFHGRCYKAVESILPRRTVKLGRDATPSSFSAAIRNLADRALEHAGTRVGGP